MIDSNGCDQAFKYAYLDEYPLYNKGENEHEHEMRAVRCGGSLVPGRAGL